MLNYNAKEMKKKGKRIYGIREDVEKLQSKLMILELVIFSLLLLVDR